MAPHRPSSTASALRIALIGLLGTVAGACSSAGAASSPAASGTGKATATRHAPTCGVVTPAAVQSTLGLAVNAPTPTVNGPVTVCTYTGTGSAPSTVIVRFAQQSTRASFEAAKAQFAGHQEPTSDVTGLGDAAYSSTLGAGGIVQNTIVVLQGSTEMLVSAPAPLGQVEALARQVLPSL